LSLFGRRPKPAPEERPDPLSSRIAEPKPQPTARPAPRPAASSSGDLFGNQLDESELEIPAFLRRQAN
jgi:cell division protein FtsZ